MDKTFLKFNIIQDIICLKTDIKNIPILHEWTFIKDVSQKLKNKCISCWVKSNHKNPYVFRNKKKCVWMKIIHISWLNTKISKKKKIFIFFQFNDNFKRYHKFHANPPTKKKDLF